MCGRFSFTSIEEIYELRRILQEIGANLGTDALSMIKTGDMRPTDMAPALCTTSKGEYATLLRWGYPMKNSTGSIINARSENICEKPIFSRSIAARRCLIPATGFFEWHGEGKAKQKYHIRLKGEDFFYLAGLYDTYPVKNTPAQCFVVMTGDAQGDMKQIHERMPMLVPPGRKDLWLKSCSIEELQAENESRELLIEAV